MWFQNIFRGKPKGQAAMQPAGVEVTLSSQALRQLDHLQLAAGRFLPGKGAGTRPSVRRKPSYDFRDHRVYVPGDDIRYIDWKASARQEHVFIRQGEQPKDASVFLLLDCSASMAWGEPSKRAAQLELAAALGYLALAHGDRLTVLPYGESLQAPLGPLSGKGQVPALVNYLRSRSYGGGTHLSSAVQFLTGRAERGGLVLVLSDFFDTMSLAESLQRLPVPAWDVCLVQMLHPEEIHPTRRGNFEMVDAETGRKANYDLDQRALQRYAVERREWQERLETICEEGNAFFTTVQSDWSLERETIAHLHSTHLLRPL